MHFESDILFSSWSWVSSQSFHYKLNSPGFLITARAFHIWSYASNPSGKVIKINRRHPYNCLCSYTISFLPSLQYIFTLMAKKQIPRVLILFWCSSNLSESAWPSGKMETFKPYKGGEKQGQQKPHGRLQKFNLKLSTVQKPLYYWGIGYSWRRTSY